MYSLYESKKACLKDSFPFSMNSTLVDAMLKHELLSFLGAYSGYNQILMIQMTRKKVPLWGIYCYKAMPLRLKNEGATYQRLVNKMFQEQIDKTMEVYIDNMLVKSIKAIDHLEHLKQTFDIIER